MDMHIRVSRMGMYKKGWEHRITFPLTQENAKRLSSYLLSYPHLLSCLPSPLSLSSPHSLYSPLLYLVVPTALTSSLFPEQLNSCCFSLNYSSSRFLTIYSLFQASENAFPCLPCIKQPHFLFTLYIYLPWILLQRSYSYLLSVSFHYCQDFILFFPQCPPSNLAFSNYLLNDWISIFFFSGFFLCFKKQQAGHSCSLASKKVTLPSLYQMFLQRLSRGFFSLLTMQNFMFYYFFTSQAKASVF